MVAGEGVPVGLGWIPPHPAPLSPAGLGFSIQPDGFPQTCRRGTRRVRPVSAGTGWRRGDARLVAADGGTPAPPHPDPSPGDPPRYSRAQEAKAGRLIGAAGGRALWFAGVTVPGMTGWGMSHPPLGEVACACVCEWGFACAIDSFVTGTDGLFWGFSPRGSPAPR